MQEWIKIKAFRLCLHIITPSGETGKDKMSLAAGAVTQSFAEMAWMTTGRTAACRREAYEKLSVDLPVVYPIFLPINIVPTLPPFTIL